MLQYNGSSSVKSLLENHSYQYISIQTVSNSGYQQSAMQKAGVDFNPQSCRSSNPSLLGKVQAGYQEKVLHKNMLCFYDWLLPSTFILL